MEKLAHDLWELAAKAQRDKAKYADGIPHLIIEFYCDRLRLLLSQAMRLPPVQNPSPAKPMVGGAA
jgi:hypothetical protein